MQRSGVVPHRPSGVDAAGCLAILLAACALPAYAGDIPTRSTDPGVELAKALAWPCLVLLLGLVFREPVGRFLSSIGGRVSKLSAFNVAIELASEK